MALDILIAAVLVTGAIIGYYRGIITQGGQIAAVLLAITGARLAGGTLATLFSSTPQPSAATTVVAYTLAFGICYLIVWTVVRMLRKVVETVHLGIIDRMAGAIFKSAQWCLMLSLALNLLIHISPQSDIVELRDKPFRQAVVSFGPAVLGYLCDIIQNNNASNSVKSQTANV